VAAVNHSTNTLSLSNAASVSEAGDVLTFIDDPNDSESSGHPVVFAATVAPGSPGSGAPTGTLTWTVIGSDSSSVICATGASNNVNPTGVEQCKVPQGQLLASGSPYTVTATYSGDANYTGDSGTFSQIINPAESRTFVAGTRVPVDSSTSVNFTASVVPTKFGDPPTGTVTFTFIALPIKVSSCRLNASSAVINCPSGSLSGVVAGYQVSDLTTPSAIPSGTTVLSVGTPLASSATLSTILTSGLTSQQLLFIPAGSGVPVISCTGGNTQSIAAAGTTCTVAAGFPSANAIWGLVVGYSGDTNNAASVSRQLKMHIQ
jgi:hypothetical protein